MSKLNNIIIEGTITRISELKKINNLSLIQFSIKSPQSNKEESKSTFFINISAWGDAADSASKKIKEGSDVVVSGKLRHGSWIDKTGNKKENHFVLASDIKFINYDVKVENKAVGNEEEFVNDLPF